MSDIVERLRAPRKCTQFDSAGRMVQFDGEPTPIEIEAAAEIERLRALTTWQPIEKAKKGTTVLLYEPQIPPRSVPTPARMVVDKWPTSYPRQASHFLPLPPPPEDKT